MRPWYYWLLAWGALSVVVSLGLGQFLKRRDWGNSTPLRNNEKSREDMGSIT